MLNLDPMKDTLTQFQSLVEIVARLRGPDGCPWDKEQSQKSLAQFSIEEAFELAEAIESGNQSHVKEELGDFLFQVILQSQVSKDNNGFELKDVLQDLNEKLIRRHPHVFSDVKAKDIEEVWRNWERLKAQEKAAQKTSNPFSYPRKMPALQAANKIGVKTQKLKFDWSTADQVFEKVQEEVFETKEALKSGNKKDIAHEIGDALFSLAQLARHCDLDPEACLREANRRFEKRFNKVLELAGSDREAFIDLSTEKKEKLWVLAKKQT
ncbi:MAG: nucleoside triphosphate pyrophosphohydrolase [Oligoflexia bacterium]|nr:MAG: nucleoside triphosphate pyrophosphohydrolase [Oligoflexia bacterium]